MTSTLFTRNKLLLFCGLLLFLGACSTQQERTSGNNKKHDKECAVNVQKELAALAAHHYPDTIQIAELKKLYDQTPHTCKAEVIKRVISNLFEIAYTNPTSKKNVYTFYRSIIADTTLDGHSLLRTNIRLASYFLYIENNTDSAISILATCRLKYGQYVDDTLGKGFCALMGETMLRKAHLQEAATYYLKAISIAEQLSDSAAAAGFSMNFANIYGKMREYEKASVLRRKALQYFASKKDNQSVMICLQGLGSDFGSRHMYDSAIYYNNKCLEMIANGVKNPISTFLLYKNVGGIAIGTNQFDTARFYFDKARALLNTYSHNELDEISYIMTSAVAYAPIKNVDEDIRKIKEYIPVFLQDGDLTNARDAYYCLYNIYVLQEKSKDALYYYQLWDDLKNKMANQENQQYIAELATRYETQKKELKIQVQQKELVQKSTSNKLLLSLLSIGGISTAFAFTRIKLRKNRIDSERQRQFTHQLLRNTEEERGRIARDLHDGIGQELFLLKSHIVQDNGQTKDKINNIISEIRSISHNLHPAMLGQVGLKATIENMCERMMHAHHLFITSQISYGGSLPESSELQLLRIIQEALNNAVKYAGAEAAVVNITENKKWLTAEIRDNGNGFDVASTMRDKSAFGLLSIANRAKVLHGHSNITSGPEGTVITIEIPLAND